MKLCVLIDIRNDYGIGMFVNNVVLVKQRRLGQPIFFQYKWSLFYSSAFKAVFIVTWYVQSVEEVFRSRYISLSCLHIFKFAVVF